MGKKLRRSFIYIEGGLFFYLTLSLNNNSLILVPPLAAEYQCSYFYGMSSDFIKTIDQFGRLF